MDGVRCHPKFASVKCTGGKRNAVEQCIRKTAFDRFLAVHPSFRAHHLADLVLVVACARCVSVDQSVAELVEQFGGIAQFFGITNRHAPWIVNHYVGVLGNLDFIRRHENNGSHRSGQPFNPCRHTRLVIFERVVNRPAVQHITAGRVNGQVDFIKLTHRLKVTHKCRCANAPHSDFIIDADVCRFGLVSLGLDLIPRFHFDLLG